MHAASVTDRIHWVGAIDWNLRDFHGYETPNGTTYNAYLVIGDDKIALVDTVKTAFVPELLERIQSVVPLDKIDYIVVNHIEPDHNSGLRLVMQAIPGAKVVASAGGVRGIAEYHGPDLEIDAGGCRRHHRSGRQDAEVHADAHGALAGLDVHVLPRGLRAHVQRRVWAAPRDFRAIRR